MTKSSMMKVTVATAGPADTASSLEVDLRANGTVADLKDKLQPHFGPGLKLLGVRKGFSVTLEDGDKVPNRVIVHGVKTFDHIKKQDGFLGLSLELDSGLTRGLARQLQKELRDAFESHPFQDQHKKLYERVNGNVASGEYMQDFIYLLRIIQARVLPNYGYEANETGVRQMMNAFQRFITQGDVEIITETEYLNKLLGIQDVENENGRLRQKFVQPKFFSIIEVPSKPVADVASAKWELQALQKELLVGFQEESFQNKLSNLTTKFGKPQVDEPNNLEFLAALREHCLSVQSRVLPKYGFRGDNRGVMEMMTAFTPFMADPEIKSTAEEINQVLMLA